MRSPAGRVSFIIVSAFKSQRNISSCYAFIFLQVRFIRLCNLFQGELVPHPVSLLPSQIYHGRIYNKEWHSIGVLKKLDVLT